MNEEEQVKALEQAILERAQGLAEEIRARAVRQRDDILHHSAERLRQKEQRETQSAKVSAERNLRRQVQAGELRLQGRLEQLRWQLILELEQRLTERIAQLRAQPEDYADWMDQLIDEAVRLIPPDALRAEMNAEDLERFAPGWASRIERIAPGWYIELSPQPLRTLGGILFHSQNGKVRLDNRFEGRLARRSQAVRQAIQRQLFGHRTGD
ncbi:MAG: V-type proton ATPase subunit E [Gammaproteobacteria bacterium SHHR-1]